MKLVTLYLLELLFTIALIAYMAISFVQTIDQYAARQPPYTDPSLVTQETTPLITRAAQLSRPAVAAAFMQASQPPLSPALLNGDMQQKGPGISTGDKTVSGLAFLTDEEVEP